MNFCVYYTWRCAEKTFFTVIVLGVILAMLDGSLTDAVAASNLAVKTSAQTEAATTDNSASAFPPPAPMIIFQAVITQYSRADSCHTIRKGKCIMASGRPVYVGAAACPIFLDLGTQVNIDGKSYACEDRYAKWLDQKRGLPTIDIFVEKNPHGNSIKIVTIKEWESRFTAMPIYSERIKPWGFADSQKNI